MSLSAKQINAIVEGINANAERESGTGESDNTKKSLKADPGWAEKMKKRYRDKEWRREGGRNSG